MQDYIGVIERICVELKLRKYAIYLFSDQVFSDDVASLPNVFAEQGKYSDDFIAMSECDIIVGPPSTFATWAAFLGKAKRLVLTRDLLERRNQDLLKQAVDVVFPTGSYLPGDEKAGPI